MPLYNKCYDGTKHNFTLILRDRHGAEYAICTACGDSISFEGSKAPDISPSEPQVTPPVPKKILNGVDVKLKQNFDKGYFDKPKTLKEIMKELNIIEKLGVTLLDSLDYLISLGLLRMNKCPIATYVRA